MDFIKKIEQIAKSDVKKIVLPEGAEPRILKAARYITDNKIANIVLLASRDEILRTDPNMDLTGIEVVDYLNSEKIDEYAKQLYEMRKHKGLTLDDAYSLVRECSYFGTMMVYNGEADGMVSGAIHSTANTLRPALQIIKTDGYSNIVSAFFIMSLKQKHYGSNGVMLFSDCGLIENPNAEQLVDIALAAAKNFRIFVEDEPRIAMLSYSTHGSAQSEMTKKVIEATRILKEKDPSLIVDGEIQVDAAIDPKVAEIKTKGSILKGRANIFIFPDLNSGNIGYKLVERFGGASAYGPITQGLRKPVNDLSRGSTVEDIIGVIAITAVQAQNKYRQQ